MDVFEKAVAFALKAHSGQKRKFEDTPYFLHPAEAAAIASTLTDDRETVAAVMLHDTLEDTDTTLEELRREFGDRVADLVAAETEEACAGMSRSESWLYRKRSSIKELSECTDREVKIMWLSDKLSNMRAFYRHYLVEGDAIWQKLNHSDIGDQEWYYRSIAENLSEFAGTHAYNEFICLLNLVFPEVENEYKDE